MGPRDRLPDAIRVVQDIGALHLAAPPGGQALLIAGQLSAAEARRRRQLVRIREDVEAAIAGLGVTDDAAAPGAVTAGQLAAWARLGNRRRRQADAIRTRLAELDEEKALIEKYRRFFAAFDVLRRAGGALANATVFHLVLRADQAGAVVTLRQALTAAFGSAFELLSQQLDSGETVLLLVVPRSVAERVDRLLAETRVQEIPVPSAYGGGSLAEAIPLMLARHEAIPKEIAALTRERETLARADGRELCRARAALHDQLLRLDAVPFSRVTARAFVLEGWLPAAAEPRLSRALATQFGGQVVIERLETEEWEAAEAPVVLTNPRLFRPFEVVVRMMPLPRYGSIDPTPFVAVFFPVFFGLILGDLGYGALLAILSAVIYRRSRPETVLRSVAQIGGACALSSLVFGLAYGEFFGNLGRLWFGLHPLLFDREEAVVPFLILAVTLGFVHVLLGLILGVVSSARTHHPRAAIGRGLSAVMIVLILVALLGAIEVLPRAVFTPAAIALLIAFPLLIAAEGLVAPVELLSTAGNILSYARIMALGTASVMLAVVANRMVGALGSVVVGVLFALLFHLVNFALGLFSPTIHALRLHYVEFFGKFYSPGGTRYQPLGHWAAGSRR